MGRRSKTRERKPLTIKAKKWLRDLIPLIQDKELKKLTLDEIASLANKSKSTIYTYFSTKEEIYWTIAQIVLEDLTADLGKKEVDGQNMEEALRTLLQSIGKGIEGISIRFLEQLKLHYPEVWRLIEVFTNQILLNLEWIYEQGMQNGSFSRFNTTLLTTLDRHFVMNIMTNSADFEKEGLSLKALVQEYLELRLSALKKL